ncbi:hypothetical protein N8K70_01445 [Microbacterium betulae]|uniref:Uncharacterized protein n=1 Tax=Microbacterium betulae TaxID=2981139 RepID=A0AA97FH83_9MICO|nr:hypothetical protein [Microbacterium sp. AB]WOF23366.1 hypothetical protein N8K70_01445 [Microbacterium sp. AB]
MNGARRVQPVLASAMVLALSGCAAAETPATFEELCAADVVERCDGTTVIVTDEATDDEIVVFAQEVLDAAEAEGARVVLSRERPWLSEDPAPAPWSLEISPGDDGEDVVASLESMLLAAAMPDIVSYSVVQGWTYVTVTDIDRFAAVFQELSGRDEFADGATYTLSSGERLRIVHVPSRTSDEAILEIVDIARRLPEAEVLLDTLTTPGNQWPRLYVSGLTAEEVGELDAALSDPRWADADVEGYPLEYVLGAAGPDGTTYTTGTFGDVPS